MHDDCTVDLGEEAFGGGSVLGDDRVGVAARMRVDMRERARELYGDLDRELEQEELFELSGVELAEPAA